MCDPTYVTTPIRCVVGRIGRLGPTARVAGMPAPTAPTAVPVRLEGALAQAYRRFGEVDAGETSPLYQRVPSP